MREDEKVLFQSGVVLITNYRALIGPTTYPVANITSVSTFEEKNIWRLLIGALIFVWGAGIIMYDAAKGMGFFIFLAGIGLMLWHILKPEIKYWMRIGTSGTEFNTVSSTNKEWTKEAVKALNDAIIARG